MGTLTRVLTRPCMQNQRALTVPSSSRAANAVNVHATESDRVIHRSRVSICTQNGEVLTRPSAASCHLGFAEAGQVPREVPEQTPECAAGGRRQTGPVSSSKQLREPWRSGWMRLDIFPNGNENCRFMRARLGRAHALGRSPGCAHGVRFWFCCNYSKS